MDIRGFFSDVASVVRTKIHAVMHKSGWVNGHSHSFWRGEGYYTSTLCDCGIIHAVRPVGIKRKPADPLEKIVFSVVKNPNFQAKPAEERTGGEVEILCKTAFPNGVNFVLDGLKMQGFIDFTRRKDNLVYNITPAN